MKVCIDIPVDLRLHNQGVFRISKQLTSSGAWETVVSTGPISGGTYLADLEPGLYQKVLETANGQFVTFSTFKITQDAKYIDEEGTIFTIAEDGTLLKQNEESESSPKK
jgi:hypothetical protein